MYTFYIPYITMHYVMIYLCFLHVFLGIYVIFIYLSTSCNDTPMCLVFCLYFIWSHAISLCYGTSMDAYFHMCLCHVSYYRAIRLPSKAPTTQHTKLNMNHLYLCYIWLVQYILSSDDICIYIYYPIYVLYSCMIQMIYVLCLCFCIYTWLMWMLCPWS